MKHTLVPAILGILLMTAAFYRASTAPASAQEDKKGNAVTKVFAGNPQKTLFFDLHCDTCTRQTGKQINSAFRTELSSLANCALLDLRGPGGPPCGSSECARKYGKAAGAHRAVYGFVSRITKIEKKRLGATGIDKYIIRSEKHESYVIRLKVVDIENGKVISQLDRKSDPENIDTTITDMVASLGPLYGPRHDVEIAEDTGEPEEPRNAVDTAEHDTGHNGGASAYLPTVYDLGVYVSLISPMGTFRDTTTFASGNSIEARLGNIPALRNVELRPLLGYYYYSTGSDNVSSYQSWYVTLSAGYRFKIYDWLDLTPLLGGGYILHSAENSATGESAYFADPLAALRCSINFTLYRGLFLTAIPGYVVFFEQSGTGMYPSLDLGVLYRF